MAGRASVFEAGIPRRVLVEEMFPRMGHVGFHARSGPRWWSKSQGRRFTGTEEHNILRVPSSGHVMLSRQPGAARCLPGVVDVCPVGAFGAGRCRCLKTELRAGEAPRAAPPYRKAVLCSHQSTFARWGIRRRPFGDGSLERPSTVEIDSSPQSGGPRAARDARLLQALRAACASARIPRAWHRARRLIRTRATRSPRRPRSRY